MAAGTNDPPILTLSYRHRRIVAAGKRVFLPPADLAFYAVVVRRAAAGEDFISYRTPGLMQEYLDEYWRLTDEYGDGGKRVRVKRRIDALRKALEKPDERREYESLLRARFRNWFSERKAKVNRAIRTQLGASLGPTCEITARNSRPNTVFGLSIEPSRIRILDAGEER